MNVNNQRCLYVVLVNGTFYHQEVRQKDHFHPKEGSYFPVFEGSGDLHYVKVLSCIQIATAGTVPIFEVKAEVPKKVTLTMGCGHTQTVPNEALWVITDRAPSSLCKACLPHVQRYDVYSCWGTIVALDDL
jgi:hypothetical protein